MKLQVLLLAAVASVNASAALLTYVGSLSGSNEIPAVASPGTGFASVTIDTIAHTATFNITFSNLTSNTVAAHIHCCVAQPGNTAVATAVPAFAGFPLGVTAGNYASSPLSLLDAAFWNPTFVTAKGGIAQADAALTAGLAAGEAYLNIHTSNFAGGEIRANLTLLPEPGTLGMVGAALALLVAKRFRRV